MESETDPGTGSSAPPYRETMPLENSFYRSFVSTYTMEASVPPHYHPYLEMVIPEGVSGEVRISGTVHRLEDGFLYLVPPDAVHSFSIGPRDLSRVLVVIIDLEACGSILASFGGFEPGAIRSMAASVPTIFEEPTGTLISSVRLLSRFSSAPPSLQTACSDLETLARILRLLSMESDGIRVRPMREESVRRVIDIIEAFAHRPLNLDEIASRSAVSKFHLCRLFKAGTGMTIQDYLVQVRVNRASRALAQGMSVTEACYSSGFGDPSHFIKVFRRATGKTPKRWAAMADRTDRPIY